MTTRDTGAEAEEEALTLDEVWAATVEALPTGFHLRLSDWGIGLYDWQKDPATRYEAVAEFAPDSGDTSIRGEGPTQVSALAALVLAIHKFETEPLR